MTTIQLNQIAENLSKNGGTIENNIKSIANDQLKKVGKISGEDLGFDCDWTSKIFELEDSYVIVLDTDYEDFIYYEKQIDNAQKIATDKLYDAIVREQN